MPIEKPLGKPFLFEHRVRKTIREHAMISVGDRVVVAVSGGADSVALLLCLNNLAPKLHFSITAAHLNHGMRGLEGDADEDFVRRMSNDLGLPFVSELIDVRSEAAATRQNLEQLARQKRYDFLHRVAHSVMAQKIAVGHNLNDQAETAIFRFFRGSGIEGLSSIYPVVDGRVIRPLLDCSRRSIIEYLNQRGASYREDSTNKDLRHTRNRIRRELVPYLEQSFNPRLIQTVARQASMARETWALLKSQAESAFAGLHRAVDNGVALKTEEVLKLHPAMQKLVLRHALRHCLGTLRGVTAPHIEGLLSLCIGARSGDQLRLPHETEAIRQFDELVLLKRAPVPATGFSYELSVPGQCYIPEIRALFTATIDRAPSRSGTGEHSSRAFLEPAALPGSLIVRSRIPGDRYGGAGHRKVKKLLIDHKIPLDRRSILPMVAVGNDVVWIPGFRPARTYAALPGSQIVVVLEFRRDNP